MNENYIKEILNNHRVNKTLLWNTLIITFGGTIGLFFKAIGTKNSVFEIIFVLLGCFLIVALVYYIGDINLRIGKLCLHLKDKGAK